MKTIQFKIRKLTEHIEKLEHKSARLKAERSRLQQQIKERYGKGICRATGLPCETPSHWEI